MISGNSTKSAQNEKTPDYYTLQDDDERALYEWTPLQLALVENFQLVRSWRMIDGVQIGTDVHGLRLSVISGNDHNIDGLDIAFVSQAVGDVVGLQISIVNKVNRSVQGLQFGALFGNFVDEDVIGMQIAGVGNKARKMKGIQIGFVNRAEDLTGVQLGVLNFNLGGWLPCFPILNFGI